MPCSLSIIHASITMSTDCRERAVQRSAGETRSCLQSLVQEKVSPLAGDMTHEGLGLESTRAKQLAEEVDIIFNGAAITNFYERYTSQSHGTWYSAHVSGTVPGTSIPYRERGCIFVPIVLNHSKTTYHVSRYSIYRSGNFCNGYISL